MNMVATHVRIFDPDPSDDLVTKRTAAVKDVAARLKKPRQVDEIFKIANSLARAAAGETAPSSLTEEITAAIQKQATAFIAKGQELQVAVIGMMAALRAIREAAPGTGRLTSVDVLAVGLWSSLSFQSSRPEQKIEQLRCELLDAARTHVLTTAIKSRERIAVPELSLTVPVDMDVNKLGEAIKEGAKPTVDALRSNAALDREELDILWWVISDRSELLEARVSAVAPVSAALAAGFEMGRMMRRMPADAHRNLVLRNIRDEGAKTTLEELVASVAADKVKLIASLSDNQFVRAAPSAFPLIAALVSENLSVSGAGTKRTIREWAERALLESSALKVTSMLPSVGV